MAKTQDILSAVGSEMKANPPAIVRKTRQKYGPARALAQSRAILLNKSRNMGARIPQDGGGRSMSS